MICTDCQNQIFEGELDHSAVMHLSECHDCRALEREVQLNTSALAALRDEVLPVRAPRRRWPWAIGIAAAAAVIVAVITWPIAPPPIPAVPVAKVESLKVAPALPATPKPAPIRRARPARRKPEPPPPRPSR